MVLSLKHMPRALLATALVALAGCAIDRSSTPQWTRPAARAPGFLRGARVLVACDAAEAVIVQICQDQVARASRARGATPVFVPTRLRRSPPTRSVDAQLLPAARDAGAKAMMVVTVAVAVADVSQGISIGIGGFGFGRSGGGGVGVSAPVGGGSVTGLCRQRPRHRRRERAAALDREGDVTRVERRQPADGRAVEDAVRARRPRPALF